MIAARLKPGDRVGIVAPSAAVPEDLKGQFRQGLDGLRGLGLEPVPGKHLFSRSLGYAASPEEKLEDLHRFLADPTIKALFCVQGGDTANACLSDLDWERIRNRPKIFMGSSDNTVLINAIWHKTGLVTFHGNDVLWGFGRGLRDYDRREFISRLIQAERGSIPRPGQEKRSGVGGPKAALLAGICVVSSSWPGPPFSRMSKGPFSSLNPSP